MKIVALLYIVWSFQSSFTRTLSYNDYRVFKEKIHNQCKTIQCPQSTVMKIETVEVKMYRNVENDCNQMLKKEFSEKTNSKCSNKSTCLICQKRESTVHHERCAEPTVSTVSFICLSDKTIEEVVPPNTYVDLSCELIDKQMIVIHKATLIPISEQTVSDQKKGTRLMRDAEMPTSVEDVKKCQVTDVSSSISKICSRKNKCQAGPNKIIPNNCSLQNLVLKYSCVPQTILKIDNTPSESILVLETRATQMNNEKLTDIETGKDALNNKVPGNNIQSKDAELDHVWIITVLSVVVVIVVAFVSIVYWYRYKQQLSASSLASKVKLANFSPPPSSIEKIEIDLSLDSRLLLKTSLNYQVLNDSLRCGEDDYDFWKSTLSRYTTDSVRIDVPSCSMSAGSSGQMSTYQSESSKGNTSAVFNYISRDKSPSEQTPL